MPFPTEFPQQQFERLIDFALGGDQHTARSLIQDCYDILGYGLNQGLPDDSPVVLAVVRANTPLGDIARALKQSLLGGEQNIPWEVVMPLVKLLLDQLWNRLFR